MVVRESARVFPHAHASYEDFQLPEWLKYWDEIVHLDTDLVVANDTPWLLTQSQGVMCAVDESYFEDRTELLSNYATRTQRPVVGHKRYFNLGVFGVTKADASLWTEPDFWNEDNNGHQTPVNYRIAASNHRVRDLGPDFNSMVFSWKKYDPSTAYITHFAGMRELDWVMAETKRVIEVLKGHGRA